MHRCSMCDAFCILHGTYYLLCNWKMDLPAMGLIVNNFKKPQIIAPLLHARWLWALKVCTACCPLALWNVGGGRWLHRCSGPAAPSHAAQQVCLALVAGGCRHGTPRHWSASHMRSIMQPKSEQSGCHRKKNINCTLRGLHWSVPGLCLWGHNWHDPGHFHTQQKKTE